MAILGRFPLSRKDVERRARAHPTRRGAPDGPARRCRYQLRCIHRLTAQASPVPSSDSSTFE